MDYAEQVLQLIRSDRQGMAVLSAVRSLRLPDWLIAAGFVRNRIWDRVFMTTTPLADIDVIYFCNKDVSAERDLMLERHLSEMLPVLPWSVKNQARMHIRNEDLPYSNTLDAMAYWPEKQTAIGVSLNDRNALLLKHCFPLDLQFSGKVDYNPACDYQVFLQRLMKKSWLSDWPELEVSTRLVD